MQIHCLVNENAVRASEPVVLHHLLSESAVRASDPVVILVEDHLANVNASRVFVLHCLVQYLVNETEAEYPFLSEEDRLVNAMHPAKAVVDHLAIERYISYLSVVTDHHPVNVNAVEPSTRVPESCMDRLPQYQQKSLSQDHILATPLLVA